MSLSLSQEDAAQQALASLDAALAHAFVVVAPTVSTWGSGNVKDAVLKNLGADGDRIDRLRNDLLESVRDGSLAWGNWVGIAETTHADIAYQSGLTSEWSLSGVLRSAVSETGITLGEGFPTWVKVMGFAVLGVAALHYLSPVLGLISSRRKLAGYRRRR